jgi:hypothetical protein
MAKLKQIKPGKREILVSLLIFGGVAILVVFSSFPGLTISSQQAGATPPMAASSGLFASNENVQSSFSAEYATVPTGGRVVNTSEALVGELKHGSFEPVTGQIISNLTSIGGYIVSSNLMYNGTTWLGLYSVNVPTQSATQFLFQVTNIVNENGKTTSVQIETEDVTNQTGGNQSKVPYSLFALTLQEEANSTSITTKNQFSGILGSIGAILGVVLGDAAYVVLIALPIYLLILGGVLLSGRVLYPMFLKVSKTSQGKKQNQPIN